MKFKMRRIVRFTFQIFIILCFITNYCAGRKNVLFLMADDFRFQLGVHHGNGFISPKMHTPNLDKLAKRSMVFKQAYMQQALCGPSRTSILTGRRPDTTHVYDAQYWRKVTGNFTTIPQYFKNHGYETIGVGKIFHPYKGSDKNDPISWSRKFYHALKTDWEKSHISWISVPDSQLKAKPLVDQQIADHAISVLQDLTAGKNSDRQPFFLAVGFHRPHLPFVFPASILKHYPENNIQLPDNSYAPINLPEVAWSSYPELRNFHDLQPLRLTGNYNTTLPDKKVLELRRAYYCSVTWMDSQVGRVLDTLERVDLTNNTIISFLGDHGWQLGEHGEWCKHTNFEITTHAPLMISIPGMTDSGLVTSELTEFVDLFPTLVEATGLPTLPVCPEDSRNVTACHEGLSLIPLIKNPEEPWKSAAFSQFRRIWNGHETMGYTMKTMDGFRYTEWVKFNVFEPEWNTLYGVEWYDHSVDIEENYNVADEILYAHLKKSLNNRLRAGWRHALPPRFSVKN